MIMMVKCVVRDGMSNNHKTGDAERSVQKRTYCIVLLVDIICISKTLRIPDHNNNNNKSLLSRP